MDPVIVETSRRLVALIGIPVTVETFVDVVTPLTDEYVDCTVGGAVAVSVVIDNVSYSMYAIPVFAEAQE
jgi:hypothetical protein